MTNDSRDSRKGEVWEGPQDYFIRLSGDSCYVQRKAAQCASESPMTDAEQALIAACRVALAAPVLESAPIQKSAGTCMYCGHVFHAKDTSEPEVARVYAEAIAHDKVCPDNPLVKRIAELATRSMVTPNKDTERMDWLEDQCVEVRIPLAYGVWRPAA